MKISEDLKKKLIMKISEDLKKKLITKLLKAIVEIESQLAAIIIDSGYDIEPDYFTYNLKLKLKNNKATYKEIVVKYRT